MQFRIPGWRHASVAALLALACLLVAACGSSSSSDPNGLLKQTFSGTHKITSGNLDFKLTITPSGSSTIKGPITLEFAGPFQSRGKGKLPQSDFNISASAEGRSATLGILSTGSAGYVSLDGQSYQLPQPTFQKLESNFSSVATPNGSSSGNPTLSKFGIQPLNWLTNPTVVGTESIGGTSTTHIRAGVNIPALVNGISDFLKKASTLGVSGTTKYTNGLSASTKSKIAGEIQSPSFDVWTGASDKTLRRLQIGLTIPVTGQFSSELGGLSSATVGVTVQYTNLNQPQTITAPTSVQPYSQFQAKIQSFVSALSGAVGGSTGSAGSSSTTGSAGTATTSAGTTTSSAGSSSTVTAYSRCIQAAGNDVTKMQQCASLLNK